jgi:hypothetical protein
MALLMLCVSDCARLTSSNLLVRLGLLLGLFEGTLGSGSVNSMVL